MIHYSMALHNEATLYLSATQYSSIDVGGYWAQATGIEELGPDIRDVDDHHARSARRILRAIREKRAKVFARGT